MSLMHTGSDRWGWVTDTCTATVEQKCGHRNMFTNWHGHMHSYRCTGLRTDMYTGSHMHKQAQSGVAQLLGIQKYHYIWSNACSMVKISRVAMSCIFSLRSYLEGDKYWWRSVCMSKYPFPHAQELSCRRCIWQQSHAGMHETGCMSLACKQKLDASKM